MSDLIVVNIYKAESELGIYIVHIIMACSLHSLGSYKLLRAIHMKSIFSDPLLNNGLVAKDKFVYYLLTSNLN